MLRTIRSESGRSRQPRFTPVVAEWTARRFEAPTPAQRLAWPAIARGDNVLVFAPTGSGKTLAAFLWALDELIATGARGPLPAPPYVIYISPLRALANDIEKNLLTPLAEMRALAQERGEEFPDIRVAVRTGDTPVSERQQMLRRPPHLLITTPESLYLLLASSFRDHLHAVRYVIVDEIHHLSGDKRGAHLAITLERLAEFTARDEPSRTFARIGLSATQSPVEEIARFLVGRDDAGRERNCTIVDLGAHRRLDLRVVAPVPNLAEARPEEVWNAIYDQLLHLISAHRTTLIFCNSRHLTERVAAKLNLLSEERASGLRIGAHHGSMSRAFRLEMENDLKSGALRAIVATSSLELGIDIGHLDLVCQIQSPKTVAAGLQRVGRAGHLLGLTSTGRLFPTHRDDLVEMAVLAKAMLEADLEPVHIPENCLDVAAQHIAAMAALEEGAAADMLRVIRRAHSFRGLAERDFHLLLQQLSGRCEDRELFEARARINWDPAAGRATGARGAAGIVRQNVGAIPEYAEYTVYAEDYRKNLGSLDEEFVERLRPGRIFVLGTRTWEFLRVERNRVYVRDSQGRAPTIPRWAGPDYMRRSFQLGDQLAQFRTALFARLFGDPQGLRDWLMEEYLLDESGAQQVIEYFVEQAHSLDVWPGRETIVAEAFRSPLGQWQLLVHSPYGAAVNETWAEALVQAARRDLQVELEAACSDDAFVLYLPPDADIPADRLLALVTPDNLRPLIESYVRESALFPVRFRHAAVRALAVLRMRGGNKLPVWHQEAISRRLLQEVTDLPHFPLIAETLRECVEDHLDLAGLARLLQEIAAGRIALVPTQVEVPSPFGHGLLLAGQLGPMGEAGRRERRAELLALHREILKQILDEDSIRDLLSPRVIGDFEARRQGTHARARARDPEELLRLLRRCGELSEDPASPLFVGRRAGEGWQEWLRSLHREHRALPILLPDAARDRRRWIAAEDYALFALAFGAQPDPAARHRQAPDPAEWPAARGPAAATPAAARRALLLRALRSLGPVPVSDLAARYGLTERQVSDALRQPLRTGEVQRGAFVSGRPAPQVCARANLEELHRLALAALRREAEPVSLGRYLSFLLKWQHLHPSANLDGPDGVRAVIAKTVGYGAYPRVWERDLLTPRLKSPPASDLAAQVSRGDLHLGQFNLGQDRPRPLLAATTFLPCERARDLVETPPADDLTAPALSVLSSLTDRGRQSLSDLTAATGLPEQEVVPALWQLFRSGLAANTDYAAVSRCRWTSPARRDRPEPGAPDAADDSADEENASPTLDYRRSGLRADRGRWYAVQSIADPDRDPAALGARIRARVLALISRYGIAAREVLITKSGLSPRDISRGLRELFLRGQLLRGFFVRDLSGDQFALPAALDQLRKEQPPPSDPAVMISSLDPAALHLTAVRVPGLQNRALATRYLILHRGDLSAIVDVHSGESRFLRVRDLRFLDHPGLSSAQRRLVALALLQYAIRWGRWEMVYITHVDGQPVTGETPAVPDFEAAGFRLLRGRLAYRLRKRAGAAAEEPLRRIVPTEEQKREDIHPLSQPVLDFYRHIITDYLPPPDKDMLVFFQCSVSRPYSSSPSHASMRKAIRLATGKDPRADFDDCRCHVVVLSSIIGPVPYELETVYPADERGGGVKHMSPQDYDSAMPVLAERMAAYLRKWHSRYRVITTFTHGRYGEVMQQAKRLAGLDFAVLPDLRRAGLTTGRTYWGKYWIQLFFELLAGMTEAERAEAMDRLAREGVEIQG